jgi:HEAT repeat protein
VLGVCKQVTETSIQGLVEALSDEDPYTRLGAATALWQIGPRAKASVATLLREMERYEDPLFRATFAGTAIKLDPDNRKAIRELRKQMSFLIHQLSFTDVDHRSSWLFAADVLGQLGADAKEALPALTEALKHNSEDIRKAAADAVCRIRGGM